MPTSNLVDNRFVDIVLDIYKKLDISERKALTYPNLIEKVANIFFTTDRPRSYKKRCYEKFRAYYFSHTLTLASTHPKSSSDYVYLEDIQPLLEHDTSKESLQALLNDNYYRYYWFDSTVTTEHYEKENRRILIFESDEETINDLYRIIGLGFDTLYESAFCGHCGLAIIFNNTAGSKCFETFLDCIRNKKEKVLF